MRREGEREGEKHQRVVACHRSPDGDLACNPGMCPDWELNQRPFDLQAGTQSSELHQPGPRKDVLRRKEKKMTKQGIRKRETERRERTGGRGRGRKERTTTCGPANQK